MAQVKCDRLTRQTDDTLHVHNAVAGRTNRYYVSPAGLMEDITESVDEVRSSLLVSGHHADALDANRQQHIPEQDKAGNAEYDNPQSGAFWISPNDHSLQPTRAGTCLQVFFHRHFFHVSRRR